ncbi:MAG: formyltransferase family protein [Pseudomonadota bacterium]
MRYSNADISLKALQVVLLANWGLGREILETLARRPDLEVVRVITRRQEGHPDPWYNTVYELATAKGLKTVDQSILSMPALRELLLDCRADLMIVHAFMHRLPSEVFSAPRLGTINVHGSLLPKYRGPSPTYWVVWNREPSTGLTSHFMTDGLDSGGIIHQVMFPVGPEDTVSSILEKQKLHVGELIEGTLRKLNDPGFKARLQDESLATNAPRPQ